MNIKDIKSQWEKNGKNLVKPKKFIANDKLGEIYFVIDDNSTIFLFVKAKSNSTFAIPKKYCKIETDHYLILDSNKMNIISCPKKNNYELFVQKYLIKL